MRPDIVLIDIRLKGEIDGIETALKIKKDFNIPVIFVSAHFDGATLDRARAIHPGGFIKKPFDDDDLRVAIELGIKKYVFRSGLSHFPAFSGLLSGSPGSHVP